MNINYLEMPCFGVAGNFTGHLEQAGEASDFVNVKTAEVNAPKALFPTFIPCVKKENSVTPDFLKVFPFDSERINFPKGEQKLQIEPECAVICDVVWEEDKIKELKPVYFGASNDCSIRKEGAKKISLKKNWGKCTKGFSSNIIAVDKFSKGGILDNYRIASFLVRDGKAYAYGEDSCVKDYSYIYEKLLSWCVDKLNNQKDEGPAEKIHDYLLECGKVSKLLISIGATRYTDFGEHNFLQNGDLSVVVVYPQNKYTFDQIKEKVVGNNLKDKDISALIQKVYL